MLWTSLKAVLLVVVAIREVKSRVASPATGVSQTGRMKVGEYKNGKCHIQGKYPHDLHSIDSTVIARVHALGSTWEERCRECSCTPYGAFCEGPRCQMAYDFSLENWCTEWSDDECCCDILGCSVNGTHYDIGALYPYGDGNPCLQCTCEVGTTKEHCLLQQCQTYALVCEGSTVTYSDDCCPHYHCPHGVFCDVIPDPFPETPRHELEDWYGGHLDPIPLGMNQHFHLDSWNAYVCSCHSGGTATCRMQRFGNY